MYTPDYPPLKAALPRQQEKVRTIRAKVEVRRPRILDKLAETAAEAAWHVHRVDTPEAAATAVAEVAAALRAKSVVRSAEEIFKRVDVDAALDDAAAVGQGSRHDQLAVAVIDHLPRLQPGPAGEDDSASPQQDGVSLDVVDEAVGGILEGVGARFRRRLE